MEENAKVSANIEENIRYMNMILPVEESFDIVQRDMEIGGKLSTFFFIDGFTKDEVLQKLMSGFIGIKKEDMPTSATEFSQKQLPYIEVDVLDDFDQIIKTNGGY